jgi:kynureninase
MQHQPEAWRNRFPILERTNYLVTHSLGAMPRTVFAKLQGFADQWATRGVRAWAEGWWTAPVDVGNSLGRLLNAPKDTVVMHQNVSVIQGLVASALDFSGRRNKVVYTDQNFPSIMYVWEGMKKHGARIECVESPDSIGVPTEKLVAAIDEETLIVPISHVCFRSSYLQDAKEICRRAREVGALVLLDTYQSLGTVPVDVEELGVDMVCGGSVKWLCGGPGAGYLYVRPGLMSELEPGLTGWAAHAEPFAFEPGEQRYADGPMRLLHGSPAVASLMHATAGYDVVHEVGVDTIRRWSIELTEELRADMTDRGVAVTSPGDVAKRGGTLTIGRDDDENGPAFVNALAEHNILVDQRPEAGIRVSPHFYTRREERRAFAEVMSALRAEGSWKEHVAVHGAY